MTKAQSLVMFNYNRSDFQKEHIIFQAIMLLSLTLLTLLTLSVVKVYSNSLFDRHENIWEGSQVYIYKKDLFHKRQAVEEKNQ